MGINRILSKIGKAVREGGISLLLVRSIRLFWDYQLRQFSPVTGCHTVIGGGNEIAYKQSRLGDKLFSTEILSYNYESAILQSISHEVSFGDNVVVVGGGHGISAALSYKMSGKKVTVFEASKERVLSIKNAAKVSDSDFQIFHELVGEEVSVSGEIDSAGHRRPEDLPECDVLELDVEGSEASILSNLETRPEIIIVETHGVYNSPTEKVERKLNELDYEITNKRIANGTKTHKEKDVNVLTAKKTD